MARGNAVQKGRLCLLLLAAMLCMMLPLAHAAADERPTLRVGVLNHTTYAAQDENGNWSGLDIECMISIAQRAGFNLEFVDSSADPDFLGGLDSGRYDIVADVGKTPERAAKYLFTDEAIGNTNSTLSVRSDDDRWDYGNIEQLSQMKIGVIASYTSNADFRRWCAEHGVTPEIREYADMMQMTAALRRGDIDGEVYTAVYGSGDEAEIRPIMKFLPTSFYYVFRREDTALKNQVDNALTQIFIGDAEYLSNLQNKYEAQYKVNTLPFSQAEKNYIAAHPVITVAVIAHDEPYYERQSDGTDAGMIPDYYALLARDTGLNFQYAVYETFPEAVAAVKSGEVDMMGLFSNGVIAAQQYGLVLTDSFFSVNRILLAKAGRDLSQIDRVAVRKGTPDSLLEHLSREFPQMTMMPYGTVQQCVNALQNGEAAALLIGMPSAHWLVNQMNTNAYSIIPMPGASFNLCGAVSSSNPLLCSILNKRISATRDNFSGILAKNTLPKSNWKTALLRIPSLVFVLVVVILLALVFGLTWTLIMLRMRQRERNAVLAAQAETERQKLQVEAMQKNAEERNEFFANISHDMRTPLNAITNFIRLARKADLPLLQRDSYLVKAESSSQLMLELIDDTLTVSKLSGGKLELHLQPCRAVELWERVALPLKEDAAQKKIDFQVDFSAVQDEVIAADRLNIEKIFLNLLTNAVRYTPEGGHIWYTVSQTTDTSGQAMYSVTVRDDGIGIHESFLPRLFEPFAQEKRHGYESVGTGLGLSIVKQLIDLMGGTIEVKSRVGKGTSFLVKLRFRRLPSAAVRQDQAETLGDLAALKDRKVLLCEDNVLNREIAIALLSDKGLNVVSAENGRLGLEKFAASAVGTYAAILMDVRMPVQDGLETTRAIRALERPDAGTVPIIAMTADAFADDVQRCREAGMDDHIAKPIDPKVMFQVLQKYIR